MRHQRPDSASAATFRRRQFVAAHRRGSLLLALLRPFAGAVLAVGAAAAAAGWVQTSPCFRISEVRVSGTDRVSAEWVSGALEPFRDDHLLWLSLSEVERRLLEHPWIEGAEIHKQLPDRLLVELSERQPAGLLRRPDDLLYIDRTGQVIAAFDPALGAADLVLVSGHGAMPEGAARALEVAERLARLEPEWASGLSEIEIVGDRDFRVFASFLPFPVVVSLDRLEEGAANLRSFAPEIARRYPGVAAVDLRFSRQIIVQPAVQPRS